MATRTPATPAGDASAATTAQRRRDRELDIGLAFFRIFKKKCNAG